MSISSVLARLGGVLVAPRRTIGALIHGREGSLYEPLLLLVLSSVIAAPAQAGRAILFLRVSALEGLQVFANLLAERLWPAAAGALGAALVLFGAIRLGRRAAPPPFGRLVDAGFYLMLPYALLVALGAALAHFGVDLWFMPHRLPKGAPSTALVRLAVAYLPTLGLLSWIVTGLAASAPRMEPEGE